MGIVEESSPILIGAQNCSSFEQGAFTGEVSTLMLKSLGIKYVIMLYICLLQLDKLL